MSWVIGDITKDGFERGLPADVDAVVHLAQSRFDRAFPEGALDVVDVNVGATARVLEYARSSGARQFVLASTATVYRPSGEPLDEGAALDCSSFYAASKRSAELLARAYSELFSCWVLRIFTTYGPGQRGRLVAQLIERVRTGEPVSVEGRTGLLLSPIHVTDVAEAVVDAAGRGLPGGHGYEVVNVGGEETIGIRAIAEGDRRCPRMPSAIRAGRRARSAWLGGRPVQARRPAPCRAQCLCRGHQADRGRIRLTFDSTQPGFSRPQDRRRSSYHACVARARPSMHRATRSRGLMASDCHHSA